jgi:hypothetical protein
MHVQPCEINSETYYTAAERTGCDFIKMLRLIITVGLVTYPHRFAFIINADVTITASAHIRIYSWNNNTPEINGRNVVKRPRGKAITPIRMLDQQLHSIPTNVGF